MKLVLESIIEGINTRSDGSVTIKLSTQELDNEIAGKVFGLRGKFVKVLLSDTHITTLEAELVDNTKVVGSKKISESQRLRNTLFVYHGHTNSTMDFDSFYRNEMSKVIDAYKQKLE